jgi:hypothetical protein
MRYDKEFQLKWWNARHVHAKVVCNALPKETTYRERKQVAINACFQYIQEPFWIDKLQQFKKKDDLCDAYLVARAELERSIGWDKRNLQLITNSLPDNIGTTDLINPL